MRLVSRTPCASRSFAQDSNRKLLGNLIFTLRMRMPSFTSAFHFTIYTCAISECRCILIFDSFASFFLLSSFFFFSFGGFTRSCIFHTPHAHFMIETKMNEQTAADAKMKRKMKRGKKWEHKRLIALAKARQRTKREEKKLKQRALLCFQFSSKLCAVAVAAVDVTSRFNVYM